MGKIDRFADLCTTIAAAIPGTAVLEGEITCLDSDGKPQFYLVDAPADGADLLRL